MANYLALSARITKELQELEQVVELRNIYSFNLDREQILPLVRDLRYIFENTRTDLTRFAETIAKIDLEDSASV